MAEFAEPTPTRSGAGRATSGWRSGSTPTTCSRCAPSSITIRSARALVHAAAAQQHPADRRCLDEADLAGGRPDADARRYRAQDPAAGVQGAARPLRDQLRVGRLPAAGGGAVPRGDARRAARRRGAPIPGERTRSARSTATRCASRESWSGTARTSWPRSRRTPPASPIASSASSAPWSPASDRPPPWNSRGRTSTRIRFLDYDWSLNDVK